MKKILVAATVMILSCMSLYTMAQTTASVQRENKKELKKQERALRKYEVSDLTLQQFSVDFPGATNVASTRNGNISEIGFMQNGTQYKAYYDMDNNLIGTTTRKQLSDLPAAALKTIQKDYAGCTISKIILFDDNEANDNDMWLYGKQFADADNFFAEIIKAGKPVVLQITKDGEVIFFQRL